MDPGLPGGEELIFKGGGGRGKRGKGEAGEGGGGLIRL